MRIHHLNCGSFCPWGGRFLDGRSRGMTGRLVCHCLLVETDAGLVLADTGIGLRDIAAPARRLGRRFMTTVRPRLDAGETAARQIERLGFSARDVRHIVLTHLDLDHAGGLEDFPGAEVHTLAAEHEAATRARTFTDRMRYRPAQWQEPIRWNLYPGTGGESWFGFETVRELRGLGPEILMVPLPGHTRGHSGVAVQGGHGWQLLAGDSYYHADEMLAEPRCPPGLRMMQRLMEVDREARLGNQERLRQLVREQQGVVRVFSSHDAEELARLQT